MKNKTDSLEVGIRTNQLLIPKLQVVDRNSKDVEVCVLLRLIEVACTFWRAKIILQRFVMEIYPWTIYVFGD
jgi:hypothetical protein